MRLLIIVLALASAARIAHATDQPSAAQIRLSLSGPDLRASLDRTRTTTSALEQPIEPKTAVDWRISGAKVEAGYLCGLGGIGPDSEPIPGGPGSVYSHAGTFLGGTLALPLP